MTLSEHSKGRRKGNWWPALKKENTCLTAKLFCPICGNPIDLNNYRIIDSGLVFPTVICEWKNADGTQCSFNRNVLLMCWKSNF